MRSRLRPVALKRRAQLGMQIRVHRVARNLRLVDLAALTGFSSAKLCRIESGTGPYPAWGDIEAIARALKLPDPTTLLPRGVNLRSSLRLDFGGGEQ
jgi:transcriptional regulator with XRE-family HTH domain